MSGTKVKLIECVPNFSEGRDKKVIEEILGTLDKVKLLDCDMGKSTNRTVVTYVGSPEDVIECTLKAMVKARELIDMRNHKGAHSRFGSTDVVPFIPIQNVTLEEAARYSHILAERAGKLGFTVFCYESAATKSNRKNLATIREGEYEGLEEKLKDPEWKPDYGPSEFQARSGATAIGARNFLIAVNFNLNTTSKRRASAVAFDCREQGRVKQIPPLTGEVVMDPETNKPMRVQGTCLGTKAMGWYIEEYGCCQVTMNICDIEKTSLHKAFEAVSHSARSRGMIVTGTEVVGLVPLSSIVDAGKYFLVKQQRSLGVPISHIIDIAIKSMGLSQVKEFDPKMQIIEFRLPKKETPLVDSTVTEFVLKTASESPAPGGGSVSALVGGLASSLGTMVANLSSHKRGWDEKWEFYSSYAEKGMEITNELLMYVDEDTDSFNKVMEAFKIPKSMEDRQEKIRIAYQGATDVPLNVMRAVKKSFEVIEEMSKSGLESSLSDVGVAASCALAAMKGAYLNVLINVNSMKDFKGAGEYVKTVTEEADLLLEMAVKFEKERWEFMMKKFSK